MQFERLNLLLNEKQINKLKDTTVLVIGLGGVGSYVVESLIRLNIKKIIIVDNDVIDITNLNRQLMTNLNNVGNKKTEEIYLRIKSINPYIEVVKIDSYITKENIDILFKEKIDYLVDACDTIETKKELIRQCIDKNIKMISCMGTGNKLDASLLTICDIRKTSYDPIAKIIRKMVKDERINKKIPVIYSTEKPIKGLNKIGSTSYVPATAGLLCTSYIVNDIVGEIC
ncbi:MAG: tRNA threonylcarbamoyladenosine dehydratase [Mycoplasmatota bacterium]